MSRNPPPSNTLQQIFNLNANTPGKFLLPAVQGTMDVSQQWPLAENLRVFDFTAIAGTNQVVISNPPATFHELIINCFFTTNTAGATHSNLFKTNSKNSGPTANITLARFDLTNLTQIAYIGGFYFQNVAAATAGNIFQSGLKAVYIPFPYTLTVSYTGATGGEVVTLRTLSMRLPGSQPFEALLNLL